MVDLYHYIYNLKYRNKFYGLGKPLLHNIFNTHDIIYLFILKQPQNCVESTSLNGLFYIISLTAKLTTATSCVLQFYVLVNHQLFNPGYFTGQGEPKQHYSKIKLLKTQSSFI